MKTYQIIITIQSDSRELPLIVRNDIMAAVQSLEPEVVRAVWVGALTDPSMEEKPWATALAGQIGAYMTLFGSKGHQSVTWDDLQAIADRAMRPEMANGGTAKAIPATLTP